MTVCRQPLVEAENMETSTGKMEENAEKIKSHQNAILCLENLSKYNKILIEQTHNKCF